MILILDQDSSSDIVNKGSVFFVNGIEFGGELFPILSIRDCNNAFQRAQN